jgi:hypothetical protein
MIRPTVASALVVLRARRDSACPPIVNLLISDANITYVLTDAIAPRAPPTLSRWPAGLRALGR